MLISSVDCVHNYSTKKLKLRRVAHAALT